MIHCDILRHDRKFHPRFGDAIATRPSIEEYKPGQEVWAFFPQSCDGWLRGVVEWLRGDTVRVKSGFFGAFIHNPELIAPGNWVLNS